MKNPPTVVRLTSQLKTFAAEFETFMNARRENNDWRSESQAKAKYDSVMCTHAAQHGEDRETFLSAVGEELRGLATESETVENTGRGEEVRVTSRERGREDSGVDDVGKSLHTSELHSNDIRGLGGGSTGCAED